MLAWLSTVGWSTRMCVCGKWHFVVGPLGCVYCITLFIFSHCSSEFQLGLRVVSVSSRGCESVGSGSFRVAARLALLVSHCQLSHGFSHSFLSRAGVSCHCGVTGVTGVGGRGYSRSSDHPCPVSTVGKPHLVVVADQGAPSAERARSICYPEVRAGISRTRVLCSESHSR